MTASRFLREDSVFRVLIVLALAVAICFHAMINNHKAPNGDGRRIIQHMSFADHSGEIFPLWNSDIQGGTPILASLERFTWLSWVVDVDSEFLFLAVNLAVLAAALLLSFSIYLLSRELGLSYCASLVAAMCFIFTMYMQVDVLRSGRLQVLINVAVSNVGLIAYVRHVRRRSGPWLLISGFAAGFVLCGMAHYIITTYGLFFLIFGLHYNLRREGALGRALVCFAAQAAVVSSTGILFWALFLFPALDYHLSSGVLHRIAENTRLVPWFGESVLNFFLPVCDPNRIFDTAPFLGLSALPLLAMVLDRLGRFFSDRSVPRIPLVALIFVLISFLFGVFPFNYLMHWQRQIPLFSNIRHTWAFAFTLTQGACILLASVLDVEGDLANGRRLFRPFIPVATVIGVVVLSWLFHFKAVYFGGELYRSALPDFGEQLFLGLRRYWPVLLLFVVPLAVLRSRRVVFWCLALLLAVQCVFFNFDFYHGHGFKDMSRVRAKLLKVDEYFRIYSGQLRSNVGFYLSGIPRLTGFSLYFSPEQKRMYRLLGLDGDRAARPHQVKLPSNPLDFSTNGRQLLGLKYFITRGLKRQAMPVNPLYSYNKFDIYEYPDWRQPLRLFTNWKVVKGPDRAVALAGKSKDPLATLFIEQDPGLPTIAGELFPGDSEVRIRSHSSSEWLLDVRAPSGGLLFIPEMYDKGWRATVDGQPAEVLRADGCFKAVTVLPGDHAVRLWYMPVSFVLGAWVSGVSLFLALAWLWLRRGRERRAA